MLRKVSQKKIGRNCQRKKQYHEKIAKAIARSLSKRGHYIKAYKCPLCKSWHVGHPKKTTRVMMAFWRLENQKIWKQKDKFVESGNVC